MVCCLLTGGASPCVFKQHVMMQSDVQEEGHGYGQGIDQHQDLDRQHH